VKVKTGAIQDQGPVITGPSHHGTCVEDIQPCFQGRATRGFRSLRFKKGSREIRKIDTDVTFAAKAADQGCGKEEIRVTRPVKPADETGEPVIQFRKELMFIQSADGCFVHGYLSKDWIPDRVRNDSTHQFGIRVLHKYSIDSFAGLSR